MEDERRNRFEMMKAFWKSFQSNTSEHVDDAEVEKRESEVKRILYFVLFSCFFFAFQPKSKKRKHCNSSEGEVCLLTVI